MTDYRAPAASEERNRVRVKIAHGHFRVGDTFCPPAGSVVALAQRGLVELVKAPPKITRELKATKGRGYATR